MPHLDSAEIKEIKFHSQLLLQGRRMQFKCLNSHEDRHVYRMRGCSRLDAVCIRKFRNSLACTEV